MRPASDSSRAASPPRRRTTQPPTSKRVVAVRLAGSWSSSQRCLVSENWPRSGFPAMPPNASAPSCSLRSATSSPSRSSCHAITGASGRSVGVGEHTRLPHARNADRTHGNRRRRGRGTQRVERATPQGFRVCLGAVRADVPSGDCAPGGEHGAVLSVDHGLARRRTDIEPRESGHHAPVDHLNIALIGFTWICLRIVGITSSRY